MDWTLLLTLLTLGAMIGLAAGLLGVGGGMLTVPSLTLLFTLQKYPPEHVVHLAIATSLATIMFTSISSVRAHSRRGAVLWRVALRMAPGILVGSAIGAKIAGALPTQVLALVFSAFVGFSATEMLLDRKPKPTRQLPGAVGMFGVGGAIGVASAIVGVGGGFLSVPFMTWCSVPVKRAIGTSAAIGLPIAVSGAAGFLVAGLNEPGRPAWSLGYIVLPAFVSIVVASTLAAPLGAKLAHRLSDATLRRLFALFVALLALRMLWGLLK